MPDQEQRCKTLRQFIEDNLEFINTQIKQESANNPYWHEISLVYHQLAGVEDGYNQAIKNDTTKHYSPHNQINPCGLFLLNLHAEFSELDKMLNITGNEKHEDHCSAIIKILPNNEDVLTSHNTWGNLRNMLRVFKRYTLNFNTSKAKSVAMSSYPGAIFSFDDYYITSQNLVIQETTNDFFGKWPQIKANEIVFEFVRNIIANRLAQTGNEWSKVKYIFSKFSSLTFKMYRSLCNTTVARTTINL